MHVRPADRPRAFRKLVSLLRPGGLLAVTLRDGPKEPGRDMHPVSLSEIERLAIGHGLAIVRVHRQPAGPGWAVLDLRGHAPTG
jgi:hypothetical protein